MINCKYTYVRLRSQRELCTYSVRTYSPDSWTVSTASLYLASVFFKFFKDVIINVLSMF